MGNPDEESAMNNTMLGGILISWFMILVQFNRGTMKKFNFYSYDKILSYNAMINIVIGERGVGKTYGAKVFALNRFLKKGEQFVYIRRYKSEMTESVGSDKKQKFFNQVLDEFPDHELKNTSSTLLCDGKICGYAIPLSTAHILKSASYDKVKTIIFDEFIIDKGVYHYLSNEVEQFLDLLETVGRLRNIRIFLLGNAISSINPYFVYFNLTLPYNTDVKLFKDGLILVNYIKNIEYRNHKKGTRFGKLIEGTKYSEYAIDNKFLRDSKTFIQPKTPNSKFYFKVFYSNLYFGIWIDHKQSLMFVSFDYDVNSPIEFSFTPDDHDTSRVLIRTKKSVHFQALLNYYRLGHLRFENQKVKNLFMEFLAKHLTY